MSVIFAMVIYIFGIVCGFLLGFLAHGFIEVGREIERYERELKPWKPYDR